MSYPSFKSHYIHRPVWMFFLFHAVSLCHLINSHRWQKTKKNNPKKTTTLLPKRQKALKCWKCDPARSMNSNSQSVAECFLCVLVLRSADYMYTGDKHWAILGHWPNRDTFTAIHLLWGKVKKFLDRRCPHVHCSTDSLWPVWATFLC